MRSSRRHHGVPTAGVPNPRATRRELLGLAALGVLVAGTKPARAANGQLVYASHISLAPTWFDPAETPGIVTPFMLLYALHDGLVKPMPGSAAEPCLAESYAASADGLSHSFVLRAGVKFHNGAPVTAEDVKFSFERYRGNAAGFIKEKVAAVETPDPRRVVFRLHKPWPDFLLYYSSVTGAGWIVPKKYVESVGEDGFKKEPIGAGPYKFVSFTPGVELVMEAFDGYWRKAPTVKKLVWKVIPDETTRLAALKRGEVDIAYSIRGELAEELRRAPGLELKPVVINSPFWIYFADQWDPKSPWHDARVRKAVTLALDREGINQAITLGYSPITGSIVPKDYDFYWQPPKIPHDPAAARRLLAEAGFRGGFDAGEYYCDCLLRQPWRGRVERPGGGRHPPEAAPDRAGRLHQGIFREEVSQHHPGRQRCVRQRRHADGDLRRQGRRLRLWQLSRHRRTVRPAGGGDRPRQARGDPAAHAAAGA